MPIIKRNHNAYSSFPHLMDDLFQRDLFNWNSSNYSSPNSTLPAVNIKETPERFEVEMAAPGMSRENFKIELDGNLLTIRSEIKTENDEQENEFYSRKEFSYQSFQRSFQLSRDVVDSEHIEAKYENGVLRIIIPKREEVKPKPARQINIS